MNTDFTYDLRPRGWLGCLGVLLVMGCEMGKTPIYLNDEVTATGGSGSTNPSPANGGQVAAGGATTGAGGLTNVLSVAAAGSGVGQPTAGRTSDRVGGVAGTPAPTFGGSYFGVGGSGVAGAPMPATGGYTSGTGGAPSTRLASACASVESGMVIDSTIAALSQLVVGQWLVCYGGNFCGDHVGLEYRADGTWVGLVVGSSGGLEASTDPLGHGTWKLTDDGIPGWPGRYNFASSAEGATSAVVTPLIITPDGTKMHHFGPACSGIFVRGSAVPTLATDDSGKWIGTTPVESTPSGIRTISVVESQCSSSPVAEPYLFPSTVELEATATGNWFRCIGAKDGDGDYDALELRADGTFHRLYLDTDGQLYRGRGWYRRGHWRGVQLGAGLLYSDFQLDVVDDGRVAAERGRGVFYGGQSSPMLWVPSWVMEQTNYVRIDP